MTSLFLPLHENGGKQWLKVNANRNKVTAMQKKRVGSKLSIKPGFYYSPLFQHFPARGHRVLSLYRHKVSQRAAILHIKGENRNPADKMKKPCVNAYGSPAD